MLKVKKECCNQCLFSKDKVVSNKRVKEILNDCARNDSHFVCHKTDDTCCRGFYDSRTTNLIRISERMGFVEFVD